MPTRVLQYVTPLEYFKKTFLDCRINSDLPLKIFCYTIFVHIPSQIRSTLDFRAEKCVFIGYAPNKRGYKCYNPQTKNIRVITDVSFLETQSYFTKNYLQGEKKRKEENFWQTISDPLPNPIRSPSLVFGKTRTETGYSRYVERRKSQYNFSKHRRLTSRGRNTTIGKTVPEPEFLVYAQKNTQRKSKD